MFHPRMIYGYNTLLSNLHFIICQVIAYGRLKTKEIVRMLVLKVVTFAYEKRQLTRGSKYSNLIWTLGGKLVAEKRWSLTRGGRN